MSESAYPPMDEMKQIALQMRRDTISSIYHARSGHPGGSLSCVDILTVLFHKILKPAQKRMDSYSDDYFVLSKGHAVPALYAAFASRNLISRNSLKTLRHIGSALQGHPDVSKLPLVEVSTGSLGQGVSFAAGIAVALKHQKETANVFSLVGDGELQEGQVWEMAMFAAQHQLNNFTVIVDYNKLQSDDFNVNISNLEPLDQKWSAFGWEVHEVDGHNMTDIALALSHHSQNLAPKVIIAHTIKGKGIEFMEGQPLWHGSVTMTEEQLVSSLQALGCSSSDIEEYKNAR